MKAWALLAVALLLTGVCGCPRPPAPWPPSMGDAGVADDCARAEANIRRLDCRSGEGVSLAETPALHTPFAAVCRDRANHGRNLRPDCIAGERFICSQLDVIIELPEAAPCP